MVRITLPGLRVPEGPRVIRIFHSLFQSAIALRRGGCLTERARPSVCPARQLGATRQSPQPVSEKAAAQAQQVANLPDVWIDIDAADLPTGSPLAASTVLRERLEPTARAGRPDHFAAGRALAMQEGRGRSTLKNAPLVAMLRAQGGRSSLPRNGQQQIDTAQVRAAIRHRGVGRRKPTSPPEGPGSVYSQLHGTTRRGFKLPDAR
jgi:hypothetical protein